MRYRDIIESNRRWFHSHVNYDTPEFWAWFKGSKVVDQRGNPLICYHGTYEDFDVFKLESERRRAYGINRLGFWFDEDHMTPTYFAGYSGEEIPDKAGQIMPVFLSIKKPFIFNSEPVWGEDEDILNQYAQKQEWGSMNNHLAKMDREDAWDRLFKAIGIDGMQYSDPQRTPKIEAFRAEAMSEGYDGIRLEATYADHGSRGGKPTNWWIAFTASQIKSALSNRGDFSSDNPSIHETKHISTVRRRK